MRYLLRCTFVAVLVTLISINSAVACRYLLRRACHDPCLPTGHLSVTTAAGCYLSPNCAPCASPRIQIRSARSCDCVCPQIECPQIDLPIQSETLLNEPAELIKNPQETPTLALPIDAPAKLVPMLEIQPATPVEATIEIPAEPKILPEPETPATLPTDNAPADNTDDDLFGPAEEPAVEPAVEAPVDAPADTEDDDLFAPAEEPAVEAPVDAPAETEDDDLFAPAEEPAVEAPVDAPAETEDDDLFAPAEEPAVDAPVDAPAETEDDDLFGPAEEPAVDAPVDAPADTEDDDLFGPAEEPAVDAPVDAPAETEDDDLFGPAEEPAVDAPVDAPAETEDDDLFGPAEEPAVDAPVDAPAETEDDDLFGPAEEPAVEAPVDVPADTEDDDLFGDDSDLFDLSSILRKPGGMRSDAMRVWTDNTGTFTVTAKLQSFGDGSITLLKENGRVTTLSLRRLSKLDLTFATLQASTLRTIEAAQTASR